MAAPRGGDHAVAACAGEPSCSATPTLTHFGYWVLVMLSEAPTARYG